MKSAPLADAALALVAEPVEMPTSAETSSKEFDAALEEATGEPEIVEVENKAEEEPVVITNIAYFCPPPQVEVVQLATPPTTEAAPLTEAPVQDTAETISKPIEASESKVELDPKLFEPVLPESPPESPPAVEMSKALEAQRPTVANASHGTLVAQLEKRVKNSEKTAEIAPAIEQKMPVREVSRRAVAEVARVESFHAEKPADQLLNADFELAPAETIPLKGVDSVRLVETIRTEVSSLRQRGETTMTVVLRPDSGTQISVDVSIARDGTVQAQARCERGDFNSLSAQWPQLQQSLAAHGIRIADLSNQNFSQQQNHSGAQNFQGFERGQNSAQREQREVLNFEEQFNASRGKAGATKSQSQPAAVAPSPRYWQSWA